MWNCRPKASARWASKERSCSSLHLSHGVTLAALNRAFCPSIGNRRPPQFGSRHPVLTGAPAVGAVRLFGEKPQESKRAPRLLAGLRRLEDDPLDDEQALARFTEGDLDLAQPGPHQIRSGVADSACIVNGPLRHKDES